MPKFLSWLMYAAFISDCYVYSSSSGQTCTCAIMNGDTIDAPLLKQTFNSTFPCDEEGKDTCRDLCISLAEGFKASKDGSLLSCEHIDEDVEIYVTVFSRVCDFPFAHTGVAFSNHLCCKDSKGSNCKLE